MLADSSEKSRDKDMLEILARIDREMDTVKRLLQAPPPEGGSEPEPPDSQLLPEAGKITTTEWGPSPQPPQPESQDRPQQFTSPTLISPQEAETIIGRVEKIHREEEILRRLTRVEGQVRRIIVLGAVFITSLVLMVTVLVFLVSNAQHWANFPLLSEVQKSISVKQPTVTGKEKPVGPKQEALIAKQEPDSSQKEFAPPQPGSLSLPAESPAAKGAAAEAQPPGSEATPPAAESAKDYVGSITSNKYHYPECKWAKQIRPEKMITFKSVQEARDKAYIPCPACQPPRTDQTDSSQAGTR